MLKNYFLVALRNLRKRATYSFINIFGLSVGLAFCILIFLFVRDEYSYDTFHAKGDRIVRLWRNLNHPVRGDRPGLFIPFVLGEKLKESYPEVANVVRLSSLASTVRKDDDVFTETLVFASPEFFNVFSFPILKGPENNPLPDRNSIVISEEMAIKYFGREDPVGQTLMVQFQQGEEALEVSAVAEEVPENSSITFDFVVHIEKTREFLTSNFFDSWRAAFAEAYVELSEGTTIEAFEEKLGSLEATYNEGLSGDFEARVFVQPLANVHLSSEVRDEVVETSDPKYSYILSGLGLLVLFIACVNFTTLSLGKSMDRAKEVGMRKVMGAIRSQLTKQYLGEALLTCFFSLLIAMTLAQAFLPSFNEISGKTLAMNFDLWTLLLLAGLMVSIGAAAGWYPSIVLSRLQPAAAFKSAHKMGGKNFLSSGLVILQFAISIFLIIATLVMKDQLDFLRAKDLGYDRERILEIDLSSAPDEAPQVFERYRNELTRDERILGVAASMNSFDIEWPIMGYNDEFDQLNRFTFNQVTYDYLKTMGMEIIEGRDFSRDFGTDYEQALVVNQAFVRLLGWQNGLNQPLPDKFNPDMRIVGVVKDFHFSSLHEEIKPLALALSRAPLADIDYSRGVGQIAISSAAVRIGPGETEPIVDFLKAKWRQVAPNKPFDLTFLDQTVDAHYLTEQRWGRIIRPASAVAITIACLGLFGLATLTIEKRVKEIGIRKVLGASIPKIVALVSKDLLLLVIVANVVAWPLAFFILQRWLADFAYRVEMNAPVFVFASLLTLIIAIGTISYQAIRAALTNPIDSLKI